MNEPDTAQQQEQQERRDRKDIARRKFIEEYVAYRRGIRRASSTNVGVFIRPPNLRGRPPLQPSSRELVVLTELRILPPAVP